MRRKQMLQLVFVGWALLPFSARAGAEWGGTLDKGRTQNLRFTLGAVLEFEGMVSETTRKLYDVTGATWSQADAESYGFNDFNLDGPYGAAGLSLDMAWRFFRLQLDTTFLNPSTRATARRDYYLAVGEDIEYGGGRYDHLQIPEGRTFEADLFGNMTELTLMFVPVGFRSGEFTSINPALEFGVLLFGGSYDIDAGETTGVVQYQNPPEDFAVGGVSSGFMVMGAPQWGPGVDVRFGKPGDLQVDLQVHYLFATYDGSTAWLTTADHRDKDLDFDHRNLRIHGQFEFPTGERALTLGVQIQMVETEGTISSSSLDPEEILARQERFDKEFTFKSTSVMGTAGLVF